MLLFPLPFTLVLLPQQLLQGPCVELWQLLMLEFFLRAITIALPTPQTAVANFPTFSTHSDMLNSTIPVYS